MKAIRASFLLFLWLLPSLASAEAPPDDPTQGTANEPALDGALIAVAEEESVEEDDEDVVYLPVRVGIGIDLSSRTFGLLGDESTSGAPVGFTNLRVPVHLGSSFRLEPEVGFFHQDGGLGLGVTGLLGAAGDIRTTTVRVLLGAQYVAPLSKATVAYFGPKIGLQTRSVQFESALGGAEDEEEELSGEVEIRAIDYWVGGTVGGEAFLTRHFSLGIEVGLYFISLGDPSASSGAVSVRPKDDDGRHWILSTHGSLAARIYFL